MPRDRSLGGDEMHGIAPDVHFPGRDILSGAGRDVLDLPPAWTGLTWRRRRGIARRDRHRDRHPLVVVVLRRRGRRHHEVVGPPLVGPPPELPAAVKAKVPYV